MFQNDLKIQDLVNLEYWQKVQDLFSDAFDITLQTLTDDYTPLTTISRPKRLYTLVKDITASTERPKEILNVKCPFELDAFVIPINVINNTVAAYVIAGPVRLN